MKTKSLLNDFTEYYARDSMNIKSQKYACFTHKPTSA